MSSSLGLYVQDNLIKYAKVTKDHDVIKVESFGVKFFDDIKEALEQIVSETYSYKTPISINLTNETYNYFQMFSLLNKNDLKKSIDIEFDSICYDKGINSNTLEARYALVADTQEKEKIKVIHISSSKIDINQRLQMFEGFGVNTLSPLPMAITNIIETKEKENSLVVNIENNTMVTKIADQKIYNVDIIPVGMNEILSSINQKENSYSKSYEICKNTTIYTMEGRDLIQDENMYLEDIMPTLYKIVQEVKEIVDNSADKINRIYITGTGSSINNIDLYFQEYFTECKCEILKPYFIPETVKINMKDYIEVNSAIALALQALGNGIKNINFKKQGLFDRLPEWLKIGGTEKGKEEKEDDKKKKKKSDKLSQILSKIKLPFNLNFGNVFDNMEKWLTRVLTGILALAILYTTFSIVITSSIKNKTDEIAEVKKDTEAQIKLLEDDTQTVNNKNTRYQEILDNLEKYKSESQENRKIKDSIPNFLTSLMFGMPQEVIITSITNTTGYSIRIEAQANDYAQLGFLIGNIKTTGILYNVTTSSGVKQGDVIKIVIEGSLFPE